MFVVLLGLILALALAASTDGRSTAASDNGLSATELIAAVVVVVLAFTMSVVVDPYAGPLLFAVLAVIGVATGADTFDDDTFGFVVPVAVCAAFYYGVHIWVSARVWELSDGDRKAVNDDIRQRRALVLEIGRRFLVAWTMLFALEILSGLVTSFGDHADEILSAVRDAGGVVVVIDVLALAPLRIGEARRVFDEYRQRRTASAAALVAREEPIVGITYRQPSVAVSAAGLRSARARMRRYPTVPGRHEEPAHAASEHFWTTSARL